MAGPMLKLELWVTQRQDCPAGRTCNLSSKGIFSQGARVTLNGSYSPFIASSFHTLDIALLQRASLLIFNIENHTPSMASNPVFP